MNDSSAVISILISIAALGVLAAGITFIVSLAGGWATLARSFRAQQPMPKKSLLITDARLRFFVSYRNVLLANSDAGGFYLRFWPRLAHPTLYIPWEQIEIGKPERFLFLMSQTLVLGRDQRIPLKLRAKYIETLLERAGRLGLPGDDDRSRLGLPPTFD